MMKHTETSTFYTTVFYSGAVRYFWGLNHHEKACDFFYTLPVNKVIGLQ
jgi:hypothetical protein